jgi:hypothetical protein
MSCKDYSGMRNEISYNGSKCMGFVAALFAMRNRDLAIRKMPGAAAVATFSRSMDPRLRGDDGVAVCGAMAGFACGAASISRRT